MKRMIPLFFMCIVLCLGASHLMYASDSRVQLIPADAVTATADALIKTHGPESAPRIQRGVAQAAALWRETDGDAAAFDAFCRKQFIASPEELEMVFNKMCGYFETIWGHNARAGLRLQEVLDLDAGPIHEVDRLFGSYNLGAHLTEDFYRNKIAFITVLNFPFYSLAEKNELGKNWSRKEWAYARMGDFYTVRIPSELGLKAATVASNREMYIASYNIHMGHVLNKEKKKLFPQEMVLLSHWNLRDELKSHYGFGKTGLEKQRIVHQVMKRIISQEIPVEVINSPDYDWDPFQNVVYKEGQAVTVKAEDTARYQQILNTFHMNRELDAYYPPAMDTFIKRSFDGAKEVSVEQLEAQFEKLLTSPQVKKTGTLIRKRLKRKLEAFDIWYNGFRAGSGLSEEKLNEITRKKYPNAAAMEKDFPRILGAIGFSREKAEFLSSRIVVDAARGSGHAWGPMMRDDVAHLRTRIGKNGMDYKGYNIAIHEFGHNVEQIISLHDVDYYTLNGVPNTAFSEAMAFTFQNRDLALLGLEESNAQKKYLDILDNFWNMYEIMGVSMVDLRLWQWLYKNPEADAQQVKQAMLRISKEVWNRYFAPVFGIKDQTILAVYSHMINSPLYLSNYAYGHLIDFQVASYLEGKDLAPELIRIYSAGRLTPQVWMKNAVGQEVSVDPILDAVDEALNKIKQ